MTSADTAGASMQSESLTQVFLPPFMKLASVQPGERVLDIGAADGAATIEAIRRSGVTGEVLVVSNRPETIEAVAARALAQGVTLPRTMTADPADLALSDQYWDVALCHFGLPQLSDVEQTLKEIHRVLRPVGRIVISALGERERCPLATIFLEAVTPHLPAARQAASDLFRYSETGRLARLLAELGFEDAVPHRSTEWIPFPDVDHYWQFATTTLGFGRLVAPLSAEAIVSAKATIDTRVRFARRGGRIELKVEAIILAAVK